MAEHLREQAGGCEQFGSPMYSQLLDRLADDVGSGGVTAAVLAPYEGVASEQVVPLRLLGALHRLVLERRAPALAVHYPSVGGTFAGAAAAWPVLAAVLEREPTVLRELMQHVPQTNEVGRSAALAGVLRHVAARNGPDIRLVELGASAGLNLAVDRFRVEGVGVPWGPADSPVRLTGAWRGASGPDVPVRITGREGVDLHPVDIGTVEGRLLLTSYVWADQVERFDRLRAALSVCAASPAIVRRSDAAEALDALELADGVTTVVWHSTFWHYLPASSQDRIRARLAALASAATATAGFAYARLEPGDNRGAGADFEVRLAIAPDPETVLGTAPAHGVPVTWLER